MGSYVQAMSDLLLGSLTNKHTINSVEESKP